MKVFITGGAGFLGSTLIRKASSKYELHATLHENKTVADLHNVYYHNIDIRNEEGVSALVQSIKPNIIIHTAAKGSPDYCEKNPKDAWDINVNGTRNILEASTAINARVYAMSSNQVYDGIHGPFNEDSPLRPVNIYGKTKKQNEEDIHKYKNAVIIRPITMYGWANPKGQQNMACSIIRNLSNGIPMNVTNDMYNNYLYVGQMASAIWELIDKNIAIKSINVAGSERISLSTFALSVASIFNLKSELISPVPKKFFRDESPRPLDTTYDISKFNKLFQTKALSISEGLSKMKRAESSIKWRKN